MRTIVNISLPQSMAETVERAVEEGQFASKSEFFRALVRDWEAAKLAKELRVSKREIAAGKGKKLDSLADLR